MVASLTTVFTARRKEPVLVAPARPTPHELKPLSDIDDQQGLRYHISGIHLYRHHDPSSKAAGNGNGNGHGKDPVTVVRAALAEVLVFYYPLAGRVREGPGRKLSVDCTGEGVLFVEADADIRLDDLGANPRPPFPCLEELVYNYDAEGKTVSIIDSPLMLVQVTRFKCGGFVLTHRTNHTLIDAQGMGQFLTALAELARGAEAPTVVPVWGRELLMARTPPRVTHAHPEFEEVVFDPRTSRSNALALASAGDLVHRSFFFGHKDMEALKRNVSPTSKCTQFELLTGVVWRSRTLALDFEPEDEIRVRIWVNARGKLRPPLPAGFWGNAVASPVARSSAGVLRREPLRYAVGLVMEAKATVTAEYMQSVADLMVARGRPHYTMARTFDVSDTTRASFDGIDLGVGEAVYGGPAMGGEVPEEMSYFIRFNNGILVPICLPAPAMERFQAEIQSITMNTKPFLSEP